MIKIKKFLAVLLAGCMLLGTTGCAMGKHYGEVATAKNEEGKEVVISDGLYLYYSYCSFTDCISELQAAGDSTTKVSKVLKANITTSDGEEITGKEYISQQVEYYLGLYAATELMFEEAGLSLSKEDENAIQDLVDGYWPYVKEEMEPNGVSEDTYYLVMEDYYKSQKLLEHYYGEEEVLSEDEIDAKIEETYMRRYLVKFPKTTLEFKALDDDVAAQIEDLVAKCCEAVSSGTEWSTAIDEYMPQVLALSTEQEYTTADDYLIDEYVPFSGSSYATKQIEQMSKEEVGTVNFYVDTRYIYAYEKTDIFNKDDKYTEQAEVLQNEARQTEYQNKVAEYQEKISVSYNDDATEYYDFKKLKYTA